MWLLDFIPNWIFHLCVIISLLALGASYILTFVPFISTYKTPIQAASVIVLVFGVFMEGVISNNDAWKLKVAEAEKRALVAEAKASEENVKIITKVVEKIKVVRDARYEVGNQISANASAIDSKCVVIPEAINILNQAAATPGVK